MLSGYMKVSPIETKPLWVEVVANFQAHDQHKSNSFQRLHQRLLFAYIAICSKRLFSWFKGTENSSYTEDAQFNTLRSLHNAVWAFETFLVHAVRGQACLLQNSHKNFRKLQNFTLKHLLTDTSFGSSISFRHQEISYPMKKLNCRRRSTKQTRDLSCQPYIVEHQVPWLVSSKHLAAARKEVNHTLSHKRRFHNIQIWNGWS